MRIIKSKYLVLLVLVAVFLLFKVIVLLSSEKLIGQGEELFVGTVTQGIIEGWAWPLWDFQVQPHFGGSILTSLIAVPMFVIFGPYVISLKFASIIFYLAGLVILFLSIARHFSLRTAVLSGLLYIFSPPLLTARTLIFNGSHTETIIFNILIFSAYLDLISETRPRRQYVYFGMLCGVCFWLSYSSVLMTGSCIISWLIRYRKSRLNGGPLIFIVAFIAGLIPFFIFNFRNDFYGVQFLQANIMAVNRYSASQFFKEVFDLVFKHGPRIFLFNEFSYISGSVFNYAYYFIFWMAFLFTIHSAVIKRARAGFKYDPFIIYPLIYAVFYGLSSRHFDNTGYGIIDYRYGLVLFPVIFLVIAFWFDRLYSSKVIFIRFLGLLMSASLIIICFIGNGKLFYPVRLSNKWLYFEAYNYEHLGYVAFRRYAADINRASVLFSKIKNKKSLQEAYRGYGKEMANKLKGQVNFKEYIFIADTIIDEKLKRNFLYGIGYGLFEVARDKLNANTIKANLYNFNNIDVRESYRDFIYAGILERLLLHEQVYVPIYDFIQAIPDKYRAEAYIYYGINSCRRKLPIDCLGACKDIDNTYKKYCYIGMGGGIAAFFSGDKQKILAAFSNFGPERLEFLLLGVGLYFYKINNFDTELFEKNISLEWKEYSNKFIGSRKIFDAMLMLNTP